METRRRFNFQLVTPGAYPESQTFSHEYPESWTIGQVEDDMLMQMGRAEKYEVAPRGRKVKEAFFLIHHFRHSRMRDALQNPNDVLILECQLRGESARGGGGIDYTHHGDITNQDVIIGHGNVVRRGGEGAGIVQRSFGGGGRVPIIFGGGGFTSGSNTIIVGGIKIPSTKGFVDIRARSNGTAIARARNQPGWLIYDPRNGVSSDEPDAWVPYDPANDPPGLRVTNTLSMGTCIGCNTNGAAFNCGGGCGKASYCGQKCAQTHWTNGGHEKECK
jgi:hypothetical protein